jgi:RimJ/RimL family protein N-acetyltransferase
MTELSLSDGFFLSPVEPDDRAALVDHLQAREIWRNTLYIPYPYTEEDADAWIEERIAHRREQPAEVTFAVRNPDGTLIGVVGADDLDVGTTHRANLGYWLAKPYWGRGIMTRAARRYVQYALTQLDVVRLTAEVFCRNEASIRVLEKVGFRREGRLRKHREKDGNLLDEYFYGLLREDVGDRL